MPTTVDRMIEKLLELPSHWEVRASRRAALWVRDPDGPTFGYVYPDERETTLIASRAARMEKPCPSCGAAAGKPCRSKTGRPSGEFHRARWKTRP